MATRGTTIWPEKRIELFRAGLMGTTGTRYRFITRYFIHCSRNGISEVQILQTTELQILSHPDYTANVADYYPINSI
jgi:hypothetical protein